MSESFWISLIAAIPGILTGLATLVIVLSKIASLHDLVDGKFTEMLKLVASSSKTEGRVDGLMEATKKTTVVEDRRETTNNDGIKQVAQEVIKEIKEIKEEIKEVKIENNKEKK